MSRALAVVLSSGGLRSLVAAAIAAREYRIGMAHLNDGRVTHNQALTAFHKQVSFFKPMKHWTLDTGFFRQMSLPTESENKTALETIESTGSDPQSHLIPVREIQMLSIACGFARSIKASAVFWGCKIDPKYSNQMARYLETNQIFNQLMEVDGGEPLTIKMPLMGLEDHQIIELGYQCNVPFEASWSCQSPPSPSSPSSSESALAGIKDVPCMNCLACARRMRAFRAAQLNDPLAKK